jgi:hypothetical protein
VRRIRRKAGNLLLGVGVLTMLLGLFAAAAGGVDSGPGYQDRNYELSGRRTFGSARTTFTFTVKGDGPAEYFLIRACQPGAVFLRAFGPDDQSPAPVGPDDGTGHDGVKFEPGNLGSYTAVYRDRVSGAEFIVKNGDGHKHYYLGSGCPEGTEVTTSTVTTERESTTTTDRDTTTTTDKDTTTTTDGSTTTTKPEVTSSTESPTTTKPEVTSSTESPTTTEPEVTSSTESPTTTKPEVTSSTESPTTTKPEVTSSTESPTTTEPEVTSSTESPTTTDPDATTTSESTEITLVRPTPSHGSGDGSGTSTALLLAGLPLALSGVAVRFGEDEENS